MAHQATGVGAISRQRAKSTYSVAGAAYEAYATPTDLVGIRGSATKTVKIVGFRIAVRSTAAAVQTIDYVKRTVANTGGTGGGGGTPVKRDGLNLDATAVVDVYTAAPTISGSGASVIKTAVFASAAVGTAGFTYQDLYMLGAVSYVPPTYFGFDQPVTLRGAAEALYFNYRGAALTAGFTAGWEIIWTEE